MSWRFESKCRSEAWYVLVNQYDLALLASKFDPPPLHFFRHSTPFVFRPNLICEQVDSLSIDFDLLAFVLFYVTFWFHIVDLKRLTCLVDAQRMVQKQVFLLFLGALYGNGTYFTNQFPFAMKYAKPEADVSYL